jgi:hypothetical protein
MSTNDLDDPAREADQRAERAKASLMARLEQLKQRFADVKHQVDVRAQIAKHPLPAVGIAFALGVLAGLPGSRTPSPESTAGRSLTGAAVAGLAAVGLRLLREVALSQLGSVAKQWWIEHTGGSPGSPYEARASHQRDVEPFLEH